MMRAARRPRQAEDSEQELVTSKPVVEPSVAEARPPAPPETVPETVAETVPETVPETVANPPVAESASSAHSRAPEVTETLPANEEVKTYLTIDRRRPDAPLEELERRKRSAENLKRIGEALTAYIADKGRLPLPASKTASGVETLSWRVELLPYLGHEELYRRFDLKQTWDSPHNKPLLELIPDCYVSPERHDSSTNYLGVSGGTYLFNGNPVRLSKIEDGLENTLAIVEVDETHCVPWTCPTDYAPEAGNLRAGIGNLRPEGVYALWANGWTTLLVPEIGEQQLHKAFTYESGDGLVAGDIHRNLIIQELSEADLTAAPAAPPKVASAGTAASEPRSGPTHPDRADQAAPSRMAVPKLVELTAAMEQVQNLYADRVKAAVTVSQRRAIAEEMLIAAAEMRDDPPGAYALQSTAARLAAAIGDIQTACRAIDAQVAMFEVDPLEQNAEMLTLLGRANVSAGTVDGRAYLQRALPVLNGRILNDAYDQAKDICQFAIQFEAQSRDRVLLPNLNRLRLQIVAANHQHQRVEAALAQLRKNPSDPAANSTVGMYLAFIKGDWQQGLALLSKGKDERLAQLAAADAATGAVAPAMMSTADQWWELGEATTQKKYRDACRGRAAYWYAKAVETMPESLSRMHAQARLRETESSGASTPLDAVAQLADVLGVDLQETL